MAPHTPAYALGFLPRSPLYLAPYVPRGWLAGGARTQAEDVLTYANAVAALRCRALGARTAIPRRAEVEHLLASV